MPTVTTLGRLGLLRSHEIPEDIEVLTIETKDVDAPYSAKGVGEISFIPISAAIANAYRIYDGCVYEELPNKTKISAFLRDVIQLMKIYKRGTKNRRYRSENW